MQEEICHSRYIFNMQNRLCSLYFRREKSPHIAKINRSNSGLSYIKVNFKSILFSHVVNIWKQSLIIKRLLKCRASLTVTTTLSLTLKCEIQPVSCVEMQLLKIFTVLKFYNNFMYLIVNYILSPCCTRPCNWMSSFKSFHLAQQKLFSQPILVAAAASLLTEVLLRGWLHKGISPTLPRRRVPGKLSTR